MAAQAANTATVPLDTLITIKISVNDTLKKLKLPLRDLGATVLPDKLRQLLGIKPEQEVVFERFSDSAGGFIFLDPTNPQVFKTLARAAKAKLKLRLKATVSPLPEPEQEDTIKHEPAAENTPARMVPVIVQTPVHNEAKRGSHAADGRSIGSGIFRYREALASQQTLVDTSEAPVPEPFPANSSSIFKDLATVAQDTPQNLVIRSREPRPIIGTGGWSVYCNACDVSMIDTHYHCDLCDGGDYDLCESCVEQGRVCNGEGHWLIKRYIKDGQVVNSFTERLSPRETRTDAKTSAKTESKGETKAISPSFGGELPTIPAVPESTKETVAAQSTTPTRTCNSCVVVRDEHEFVTCNSCDDFDLCRDCHECNKHGHHPGHIFQPATEQTKLSTAANFLLPAGRNVRHNAICDGCDEKIFGVRHKCLNCPDWDFCNNCIKNASHTHPRHRFAPLYEPLVDPVLTVTRHTGVYCDGPLCRNNQSYITGVRYKCAVCNDTDFCSCCEALPGNMHNRTHPLIMFKTPVRGVSVATDNEDVSGVVRKLGDYSARAASETKSVSTETTPVQKSNAATQVQTMAEIKPTPLPVPGIFAPLPAPDTRGCTKRSSLSSLSAMFVKDMIPDGMTVQPGARFTQIWVMRNNGSVAWPSGCSVRYVGGDDMLNIDNEHPAATSDINKAKESNVMGRNVQTGEEIGFKVVMKAPLREGRHISYWRLMSADGTPFGHRLWCDIIVKGEQMPSTTSASPASAAPPSAIPSWYTVPTSMPDPTQRLRTQPFSHVAQDLAQQRKLMAQHQQQLLARHAYAHQLCALGQRQPLPTFSDALAMPPPPYVPSPRPEGRLGEPVGSKARLSDDERARRDAAKLRVEQVKARIMKMREERRATLSGCIDAVTDSPLTVGLASSSAAPSPVIGAPVAPSPAMDVLSAESVPESAIEQKKEHVSEEVAEEAAEESTEDVNGSQMVFPKLDKESPASSTYQSLSGSSSKGKAAYVENEHGEVERSATPAAAPAPFSDMASPSSELGLDDFTDDLEVLSADQLSDDDSFLTDEEYDVLDASDRETVASK